MAEEDRAPRQPPKKKYDSTIARMAGNIAASQFGLAYNLSKEADRARFAENVVALARAIVAEVERTDPLASPLPTGEEP